LKIILITIYKLKKMKKRVLFLLIAVLTASYAQAQLSIGARAGVNLTNLTEKVLIGGHEMETTFIANLVSILRFL